MSTRLKVLGIPGSGKTTYLMQIISEYLAKGVPPSKIAFCSFSQNAVNEARGRAVEKFGYDEDEFTYFRTEHSLCFRLLGLKPTQVFAGKAFDRFAMRYPVYGFMPHKRRITEDRFEDIMLLSLGDFMEFFVSYLNATMQTFEDAYRDINRKMEVPDGFNKGAARTYMQRRTEFKQKEGLYDFSDMLSVVVRKDLYPPAKVLIVDEIQDSSKLLFSVIESWSKHIKDVYIAGDPAQAIYQFAGASPELFYEFSAETEILNYTHRLTPEVSNYAQTVLSRAKLEMPEFIPCERKGEVSKKSYYSLDWHGLSSCYVLARTRWLVHLLRQELIEKAVPFICNRGADSPINSNKGKAYMSLMKLQEEGSLWTSDIQNIAAFTTKPFVKYGTKAKVKRLVNGCFNKTDLSILGFTDEFFTHLVNPDDILIKGIEDWERSYIRKVIKRYGVDFKPSIFLTTIHGAKGGERDTVILDPDYTRATWGGFCLNPVPEILLQYVAVTRARTNLYILGQRQGYAFPLPKV